MARFIRLETGENFFILVNVGNIATVKPYHMDKHQTEFLLTSGERFQARIAFETISRELMRDDKAKGEGL